MIRPGFLAGRELKPCKCLRAFHSRLVLSSGHWRRTRGVSVYLKAKVLGPEQAHRLRRLCLHLYKFPLTPIIPSPEQFLSIGSGVAPEHCQVCHRTETKPLQAGPSPARSVLLSHLLTAAPCSFVTFHPSTTWSPALDSQDSLGASAWKPSAGARKQQAPQPRGVLAWRKHEFRAGSAHWQANLRFAAQLGTWGPQPHRGKSSKMNPKETSGQDRALQL